MLHYGRIINNIIENKKLYLKSIKCDPFIFNWKWEEYYNAFNAKCDKVEEGEDQYIITIYGYTSARLEEYLKSKNINKNFYVQIVNTILEFIIGHEIFHIAFGHCTLSKKEISELDKSIRRKFENMCDLKSIDSMLPMLDMCIDAGVYNVIDGYASLLSALFIYFKILESDTLGIMTDILKNNERVEREKKGEKKLKYRGVTSLDRTHPFVTIRFDNICRQIEYHLKERRYSEQYIDEIYKKSIEYLVIFNFKEELEIKPY